MRQTLLSILAVVAIVWCSYANDLGLSDTLVIKKSRLSILLQGQNHLERVNYLNQLYSPSYSDYLKSSTEELQLDSIVKYEWLEESQTIEKSLLYTCNFENDNKDVLVDIFKWDLEEKKWTIGDQNYYYFNEEGRLKQIEFQEYVYPTYRLITRVDYVYENDLLKYESRYDRIDEIETWSELVQYEYMYYNNNLLKTLYINEWDTYENAWMTIAYITFEYDSIGNVALETGYDYDYFSMESTKKFELRYTFNEANKLVDKTEYIPGLEEGVFSPERKQENSYDELMNIKSETFYKWDYDTDYWLGTLQLNYSDYKEEAKIYETTSFIWDNKQNKWENTQKLQYYSEKNLSTFDVENWEFIETYMPAYSFNGEISDEIVDSSWEGQQWITSGYAKYYFSYSYPVGVSDLTIIEPVVFPNPVSDILTIELDKFEEVRCVIRNVNGQAVLQHNFKNRAQINIGGINAGLYFVELYANDRKIRTTKIIKR